MKLGTYYSAQINYFVQRKEIKTCSLGTNALGQGEVTNMLDNLEIIFHSTVKIRN